MRKATAMLAARPTAALARAFAEHVDLLSFRLDAWLIGLVTERLAAQRAIAPYKKGVYLGAYGYLENLRPAPARQRYNGVVPSDFTDPRRPLEVAPDNAGHILAPSLSHAVAAAVLRNAYLIHGSSDNPEAMSTDVTSARARAALDVIEGVRNGQPMSALLGYQFERGLHDMHGVIVGIDTAIYKMRAKFPLVSGQLIATPPGTPVQSVEARNVIDGLAFVRHMQTSGKQTYPFGLTFAHSPNSAQIAAINTEAARLLDTLDAVGDLMLSEGVFAAVRGNFQRAGAALDALSGASINEDPEILQTPRSGFGVNHRICLVLPATGAADAATLTPRAAMEPHLNAWLGTLLGSAAISCRVRWTLDDGVHETTVTLAELGLQPIDLIYMLEPSAVSAQGEWDRRIALAARAKASLAAGVALSIDYAAEIPDTITLFQALPLIRALKDLCLGCRPLNAPDLQQPSGMMDLVNGAANANPEGWDVAGLAARVASARARLQTLHDALSHAHAALNAPTVQIIALARASLVESANYGIVGAVPLFVVETDSASAADLAAMIDGALRQIAARLSACDASQPAATLSPARATEAWIAAARALFGADFIVLPTFTPPTSGDLASAIANSSTILRHVRATDPFPMDTWLAGLARVRKKSTAIEAVQTFSTIIGGAEPALTPLQLPYRANDYWMGGAFPDTHTPSGAPLVLTCILAPTSQLSAPCAGLVLDEWSERVPLDTQTLGGAFQFNGPNTEPPNTLLLAVTPEITGQWSWDDLVDTIVETFDLAKKRAVEPKLIDASALGQLLPAIMLPVASQPVTISTDLRRNAVHVPRFS